MLGSVRTEWSRLRERMGLPVRERAGLPLARVICVASGKGGTGKSVVASNLAYLRARSGERVLLIDFDAGLANAHLLLGLAPERDIGHVMAGETNAESALVTGPCGLKLLSGGVGRDQLANPTRRELDRLFRALEPLESQFDLIVIDHGAGLTYTFQTHVVAARSLLLVTNPEVTALSDAYAVYKKATLINPGLEVGLLVNRARDATAADAARERFQSVAMRFLGRQPASAGWVPLDMAVLDSIERRVPVAQLAPDSGAAGALRRLAAWSGLQHELDPQPFFRRARMAMG
jgi:flagellar biosynthesis protein FlhG